MRKTEYGFLGFEGESIYYIILYYIGCLFWNAYIGLGERGLDGASASRLASRYFNSYIYGCIVGRLISTLHVKHPSLRFNFRREWKRQTSATLCTYSVLRGQN